MDWLEPALRNETYGLIALGVAGAALLPAMLVGLAAVWFRWRAFRLGRLVKRFRGRRQLAEEQLSSMAAEERDLRRLMGEMEKAQARG